jgi:hypothetical protein
MLCMKPKLEFKSDGLYKKMSQDKLTVTLKTVDKKDSSLTSSRQKQNTKQLADGNCKLDNENNKK